MRTILLVDDDPALRGRLRAALDGRGFASIEAESATTAVQLARSRRPDLIVCDVVMGNGDGYQVLAALQQDARTALIPFILMTGEATDRGFRRGMDLGAADYLAKPFTPETLFASVEARLHKSLLATRAYQQQLDKWRTQLSSSLPHEILTPLTGIMSSADVLRATGGRLNPKEIVEMADGIYDSGLRLNRLFQNYLLYSQLMLWAGDSPARRAWPLSQETLALAEVLARLAPSIAKRYDRAADLQLELSAAVVLMEPGHLDALVGELLDNAFKFSHHGSPVRLSVEANATAVTIVVQDEGRGMSPEQADLIGAFSQFERETYEQQGAGLGLALVELLTSLYGGELAISGRTVAGTCVRLTLPAGGGGESI